LPGRRRLDQRFFSPAFPRPRLYLAAWLILSAFALAACSGMTIPGLAKRPQAPGNIPSPAGTLAPPAGSPEVTPVQPAGPVGPPKVGLLLPLTGASAPLGQAMLNAAEMALFDTADNGVQLLPRDTQGTAQAAANAANDVIAQGAKLIIGPLLAAEVQAVKPIAAAAHVPVLAFSNANQYAGNGVFLLGFQPGQEIARVVAFAKAKGFSRFAMLAPQSAYGTISAAAFKDAVQAANATLVRIGYYDPAATNLDPAVKQFAATMDFDALMLPEGDGKLQLLAPLLPYEGIDPDTIKFLGTGLWDESGLGVEPALSGGWYAAPSPDQRAAFQQRYLVLYRQQPPRLATLGYDATALAVALAKPSPDGGYSGDALTNPAGFNGLDGLFRLTQDGIAQRGLAVLEVQRGIPTVVDPAPANFQALGQ
jgi:ABC-type branched-subunit amino acid transport system substrate-binding protein